ncbi:hypothetical protein CANCADRAFT_14593, partial [Tortispora caseinolytica NRRL Y-17796]
AYAIGTSSANAETSKAALQGDWIDLKLVKTWDESKNTKRFRFELPEKDQVSGLVIASAVLTKFVTSNGNNVIRPYTPVTEVDTKGHLDLVIKHYEGGRMSSHIFQLKEGDTLSFKGPIPKIPVESNTFKHIVMIAGGTGITPMFQVAQSLVKDPKSKTKIDLLYGNLTPQDIILKKELDELQAASKGRLNIHYFVDSAGTTNFDGHVGFISKDYVANVLPAKKDGLKIFVCGPPGLYTAMSGNKVSPTDQGDLTGALQELGYTKDDVFKF